FRATLQTGYGSNGYTTGCFLASSECGPTSTSWRATSASPSSRSKGNCYTDYYTTAAVISATRPAACRLGPLQVAMRALRSVTAEYVSERLIVGREPAALSTDAAGRSQAIRYFGLMS